MKTYNSAPSPLLLHTRHFHNNIMYTIKYSMVQIANNPFPFGEIFSRPFLWFVECSSSPKKFGVSWTEIPKSRRKDCLSVKVKRAFVASLGKKLLTRTLSLARQDNFSVFPNLSNPRNSIWILKIVKDIDNLQLQIRSLGLFIWNSRREEAYLIFVTGATGIPV